MIIFAQLFQVERAAEVAKTGNSSTLSWQGWRKGWLEKWTLKKKKIALVNLIGLRFGD